MRYTPPECTDIPAGCFAFGRMNKDKKTCIEHTFQKAEIPAREKVAVDSSFTKQMEGEQKQYCVNTMTITRKINKNQQETMCDINKINREPAAPEQGNLKKCIKNRCFRWTKSRNCIRLIKKQTANSMNHS